MSNIIVPGMAVASENGIYVPWTDKENQELLGIWTFHKGCGFVVADGKVWLEVEGIKNIDPWLDVLVYYDSVDHRATLNWSDADQCYQVYDPWYMPYIGIIYMEDLAYRDPKTNLVPVTLRIDVIKKFMGKKS